MSITVDEIGNATFQFFSAARNPDFVKSYRIGDWGERDGILPALKWFLLGHFGECVRPESANSRGGRERVDFLVGDVAVEVAVRTKSSGKSSISRSVNASEVKKLLKHDGLSALLLLDFSNSPLAEEDLEAFKYWNSLGRGNHRISSFNVLYFFCSGSKADWFRRNIRI